ncbi:response regulator [candidate division KSB1 bacterium]
MYFSKSVLVVDDEIHICNNCKKILTEEGFSVTTALSGRECLRLIDHLTFDIILLDLKLPDIPGMELLPLIKDKQPEAAVIIITGYPTMASSAEAKTLGAVDYVTKPFTPDELVDTVKKILINE